jgi:hypothetical protein
VNQLEALITQNLTLIIQNFNFIVLRAPLKGVLKRILGGKALAIVPAGNG